MFSTDATAWFPLANARQTRDRFQEPTHPDRAMHASAKTKKRLAFASRFQWCLVIFCVQLTRYAIPGWRYSAGVKLRSSSRTYM